MDAFDKLFNNVKENESELGRALRVNDEEYIEKYLKQFDQKKDSDLFTILDNITIKKNLDFDVNTVKYNKFIVEEMLSRSHDCAPIIFMINFISDGLSNQQHYDFLVRTIPSGRKNYKDRTRQYLNEDPDELVVKILLMLFYQCRMEIADEYYEVLKVRNKVEEFVEQYKSLYLTPECERLVNRYTYNSDTKKAVNNLISSIMEVK